MAPHELIVNDFFPLEAEEPDVSPHFVSMDNPSGTATILLFLSIAPASDFYMHYTHYVISGYSTD